MSIHYSSEGSFEELAQVNMWSKTVGNPAELDIPYQALGEENIEALS